jgi:phosphoribosylformylglycinamidine synthase
MSQPKILILRAPGTNCDEETCHAFQRAGGTPRQLHVNGLLEQPGILTDYQVLCIPGGFSYGDDVGAGKIFATQIRHHLADTLRGFRDVGKLILGICNGFQVLIKCGLLDTDDSQGPAATLAWNDSGRFIDCWVQLQVRQNGQPCVYLNGIERLYLPVAHAEGKFVTRDAATLDRLRQAGQLVLRYVSADDNPNGPQGNPNGSMQDVAGMCDSTGRVFGLMPHPERHIDPTQHPNWTRRNADPDQTGPNQTGPNQTGPAEGDGLQLFRNAVEYFR